ncbi:Selenocysteine-specific elongation factor [bacterium HR36]|uniref:Selenocysteine-specific elongation factor n=1 Tax=uncultured Planctomycetota bacterium TaxID=120965 RepID=H5SJP7_9BACT|nr:selenocysteine-specific elongation factor [uncultured Planctomycetota bacterium]GBD35610.1 Selenocysteine-specific elongation factor [bacterium HR36]
MPRELILGTAGHIDHGKTSLIKALTGIDCDRLPEEKARGITIDIGFAHLELGEYRLGIVDVPGHERFIKNMLAGATGIDLALLVVAADDSVMPQTREHLEILQLLGLRHGVIAISKADLVDATTREVVALEVQELVRGTFLENAPVVFTSARTGEGLDELKQALHQVCGRVEERRVQDIFRMAIDRSFAVAGYGTVVTGSVTSGRLRVGEEVEWLPRGERLRVRGLHNHDRPVDEVHRGMRAAINLAGVKHEQIARGQELATPGYLRPSRVLTVRLHTLPDIRHPIKHRAEVRFHLGTAEILGSVALLDCDRLEAGRWALAQLFLREPVVARWGQPFVIRDPSAASTLGGGQVLQPLAQKLRRGRLDTLERLETLWRGDAEARAEVVAWFAGWQGLRSAELVQGAGLTLDELEPTISRLHATGRLLSLPLGAGKTVSLHAEVFEQLAGKLLALLGQLHAEYPLVASHDRSKVEAQLSYVGDETLVHAVTETLLARGQVVGDQRRIARADFKPKLSAAQRKLKERIVHAYRAARFQPPELSDFAQEAGGQATALKDLFEVCVAEGELVHIDGELYLHAEHEQAMRHLLREQLQGGRGLTVSEIRDLLQTTRKYAVPLCEYLDRQGFTRREGDLRFLAESGHGGQVADPPPRTEGIAIPAD